MGKNERAKKEVGRLRLRREVIRMLASDSLARVQGGIEPGCVGTKGSICWGTKPDP